MKKLTLLPLSFFSTAIIVFGQISTTKVASKTEETVYIPYDSTKNFIGKDVTKYVGQEFYLPGESIDMRKYGYSDFFTQCSEKFAGGPVYKPMVDKSYRSKYDDLAGKYFKVLAVFKSQDVKSTNFCIKLQEKQSNDTVYYNYDSEHWTAFPFVVVGFFEKQKKQLIGKEFVFYDVTLRGSTDIVTGKPVTIKTGQKWKCLDLTVEERYYHLSLVIQNLLGEKTTIRVGDVLDGSEGAKSGFNTLEVSNYRKKFGNKFFETILQHKVSIGMSKEMCIFSWGKPERINETITSGTKREQWVYEDGYLYFTNGKLTTIQ